MTNAPIASDLNLALSPKNFLISKKRKSHLFSSITTFLLPLPLFLLYQFVVGSSVLRQISFSPPLTTPIKMPYTTVYSIPRQTKTTGRHHVNTTPATSGRDMNNKRKRSSGYRQTDIVDLTQDDDLPEKDEAQRAKKKQKKKAADPSSSTKSPAAQVEKRARRRRTHPPRAFLERKDRALNQRCVKIRRHD